MIRINLKHALLLFSLSISLTAVLSAQIPGNNDNLPCVNEILVEDFSTDIPTGWEGDFMLLDPPLMEGWVLNKGATHTGNTGPDAAFSGEYYLYLETSGPAVRNSVYRVRTPTFDLTQIQEVNPSIRFRVLMYGDQIGALRVNVLSGPGYSTKEKVAEIIGQQHTSGDPSNWDEAFIDISQYEGQVIKVEFEGMKGTGSRGDIAIDLLQICNEPRIPTLSQWSLIVLALFLLIMGILHLRQSKLRRLTLKPVNRD